MNSAALKKIIARFPRARVLVLGDLILDEYIWGSVDRISPEAPVPVVWANKHTHVPGGAANVAHNIRSLDGKAMLSGVVGRDKNAEILLQELKKKGISGQGIVSEAGRFTTVKTRIIAGHQQMLRVDWEHTDPLTKALNQKISRFLAAHIKEFDAIIIEDYGKGVINAHLLEEVVSLARAREGGHRRPQTGAFPVLPGRDRDHPQPQGAGERGKEPQAQRHFQQVQGDPGPAFYRRGR